MENEIMEKVIEALDKLEECAEGMKDLPKSNWIDLAENEAELDLKIMDWVETIKFELFKGKQALTELKAIKEAKPSEAIECVEDLIFNFSVDEYVDRYDKNLATIKQALLKAQELEKVLEIIKEKKVDIFELKRCSSAKSYNESVCFKIAFIKDYELTEEEFELVKRWSKK